MPRIAPINLPSMHQVMRSGFSGWRMLLIAWLAVFFSGPGQTYGTSAFVDPMIEELGMSRSLFSTLYSIGTLASAAALMLLGRQIDRRGSRLVMALAALGLAGGTVVLGVAG
ncbi:MAG TPA: hypothetical protein VGR22_02270, partial [Thermomicrobiales bacterium]|nr:hypothetical protein [Thermomicrobiales bacterium]